MSATGSIGAMPVPCWTPALSVGDPAMDAQHREMFRLTGEVIACAEGGDCQVAEAIELLHEYAVAHFAHEEERMREVSYPGLVRHKLEHDRFVEDLLELADAHDRGGPEARGTVRLAEWLNGWMVRHVALTDSEMGRYLASSRARPRG
jgi:hemerythrin